MNSLLIVGGMVLAIIGLKGLRDVVKSIFNKIGRYIDQEPAELKELVNNIYDEAVTDISESNKIRADAWKKDLLARIDTGEIKDLKDIEDSFNNEKIFDSE
jgi:hypothetical protein